MEGSVKSIIDTVEKDKSIKFISWAITPWHAHGIEAALKYLNFKKKEVERGVLIVFDHFQTGRVLEHPQSYFAEDLEVQYNMTDSPHGRAYNYWIRMVVLLLPILNLLPKNRTIFLIGPVQPHYNLIVPLIGRNPFTRFVFVRTEEGVATYMHTLDSVKFVSLNKASIRSFLNSLRLNHGILYEKLFLSYFHNRRIDATLFTEKNEMLNENLYIFPLFKYALKQKKTDDILCFAPKTVVLCTTAWYRTDIIEDNDLVVLNNVCQFLKDKGYNIVLKLHPRGKYFMKLHTMLNIPILDGENSIESLLCHAENLPDAIISFSSTSLVTAKLFWNITAICLSDLLERNHVSDFYLKEVDSFKKVFSKYLDYPKNLDEVVISIEKKYTEEKCNI